MTFEEFAAAMLSEGFVKDSIGVPASPRVPAPVVFTRPLTGRVYWPGGQETMCRLSPNGPRGGANVWCGYEAVLAAARLREV